MRNAAPAEPPKTPRDWVLMCLMAVCMVGAALIVAIVISDLWSGRGSL